jgi:hypothetical protein
MRGIFLTFSLCIVLFGFSSNNSTSVMQDSILFKVVVHDSESITKWEYKYPFNYVFQKDQHEMKGLQAKQEVTNLFSEIPLSKASKAEELVKFLEDKGFSTIERLDVSWQEKEDHLYTWVWERE